MIRLDPTSSEPTTIAVLTVHVLDRAALRRAFGVSLLRAWKTLGHLLAREDHVPSSATIDDALQKLDALRASLCALRDATRASSDRDLDPLL